MFNLGMGEITIILILALIFLGPKKLPELASGLGKLIREIRKTTSDVKNEIQLDDVIRKPMEELREAMTLHPEELKRRDRMKRELEELARKASELQQAEAQNPPTEGDAQAQGDADPRDVAEQAAAQASEGGPGTAPSPDETTVDATGAGAAAASSTPDTVGLTVPGAAPAGTIAREPSAGHAPPPAPPLAAVLARGPGAQTADKRPTAAGTDFLRSLRAVPDARRPSPSRPNPAADPAGAADRSNTTQTLTEADLAAITVGSPPPPPAPTGHTGKTQPPPPPRLPGATPPKSSSNS